MKTIHNVIEEVARRTGRDIDLVESVLRSAESDFREFMSEKKGYSIWFPNLGTFTFRISYISKYIKMQRLHLAYWTYRLLIGQLRNNNRTIVASEENIERHKYRIKRALLIKQEYLDDHCKYNKGKAEFEAKTASSDITRLDELLDVADLVQQFKEKYKGKESYLP